MNRIPKDKTHRRFQTEQNNKPKKDSKLLTPGLDNTRLFISLTAGAGTRCMSLLSSSPSLFQIEKESDKESRLMTCGTRKQEI
jgi:hypothetical protein